MVIHIIVFYLPYWFHILGYTQMFYYNVAVPVAESSIPIKQGKMQSLSVDVNKKNFREPSVKVQLSNKRSEVNW